MKILLLFLIVSPLVAGGDYHKGIHASDPVWFILDVESSALLTLSLNHIGNISYWKSVAVVTGLRTLKEFGDQAYRQGWFGKPQGSHWFWDPRGGKMKDCFSPVISVVISFPMRRK